MDKTEVKAKISAQRVEAFGMSDPGKDRDTNEDAIGVFPDRQIFAVADGMGGYRGGDKASAAAINALSEFFTNKILTDMRADPALCRTILPESVLHAHRKVLETAEKLEVDTLVGSTIAVVFLNDTYLHSCHVGDSRIYTINLSGITRITDDHSSVGDLVRLGKMSEMQARHSPIRNQVSQALGSPYNIHPEYRCQPLRAGDLVLLCTDGLWGMVHDNRLLEISRSQETLEDLCRKLIAAANDAGGEDNISVVLLRICRLAAEKNAGQ